ncbi:hypothetical protein ACETU7_02695 [Rhodococcus sp. 3Y1]
MTKPLTEAAGIDLPDLVPGVLGLREILEPRPSSTPASCDENWDRTVLRSPAMSELGVNVAAMKVLHQPSRWSLPISTRRGASRRSGRRRGGLLGH